jgi:adenosylcobinamide-phosphate synthase
MYLLQLTLAILLDLILGDPRGYPHPVRLIGALCTLSEKVSRRLLRSPLLAGLLTVLTVLAGTAGGVGLALVVLSQLSPTLAAFAAILLLYTSIAIRDLVGHSRAVAALLLAGAPLAQTRQTLAAIVGRDTSSLSEEDICRAAVETVAENMVDGITAPLFFALLASLLAPLGGLSPIVWSAIGALGYKAINTMDSMIAYKNERYLLFGRVAARLDDLANFLPARLSGLCLIVAAFFGKFEYREAARIFRRDRLRHASPNSGHTEAAMAGALGLRLGGPAVYHGRLVDKPSIGEARRPAAVADIDRANRLVLAASAIFLILLVGLRQLLVG